MTNNRPSLNPADLDTLTGTLKHILNKFMQSMDGCLPAKVIQYDRNSNRAQVQPVIAVITTSGAQVSRAQIASIPVFRLGGGNFVMSFNLKPGDLGWIVANDRDISQFLQTYQESQPNTYRIHNFSDALFFPDKMVGVTIAEEDQDNCVIQSLDGGVKISLGADYIKFKATDFIFEGDATFMGSVEAQNGLSISPDAGGQPNVTGNIYVDGTIEATGNITPNVPAPIEDSMTQTFATDENNDMYIGNDGNLVIVTGIDAVLQACANAAKTQLGEMVLAVDQGIPNFQLIWNGNPNIPQWEAALVTTIEEVDGVDHVESISITTANNILTYVATIVTIYGTGEING